MTRDYYHLLMEKTLAVAGLAILISGCSDLCRNSTISTATAPSDDLKAVLFIRDCGATTGFSSQVSVVQANEEPTGIGTAFVADTNRGVASADSGGGPWVDMGWLSPKELLIRYDAKARVFKQNKSANGVRIKYEKVAR